MKRSPRELHDVAKRQRCEVNDHDIIVGDHSFVNIDKFAKTLKKRQANKLLKNAKIGFDMVFANKKALDKGIYTTSEKYATKRDVRLIQKTPQLDILLSDYKKNKKRLPA
ncbi:hypothetical protein AC1031_002254 [Aphanomyces cochlioides]|nr:hypothetical protein AC1031_002254 [Aphanomyces cochlioides]